MRQVSALGLFLFSLVGIGFFVMSAPHHSTIPAPAVAGTASVGATIHTDTAPLPAPAPRRNIAPPASTAAATTSVEAPSTAEAPAPLAELTIRNGGTAVYPIVANEGTYLIDAMHSLSTSGLEFTSREYPGMGAFVDSIGGVKNADGNYWILYLGGIKASVGASSVRLHQGDTVEWRYEQGY